MNCRASVQIGQEAGGPDISGNCVPHALQIAFISGVQHNSIHMPPGVTPSKSEDREPVAAPLVQRAPLVFGERFTHRLEAFSDLVFGFSLSLLAVRLDVPADISQVFEPTRWATFIVTFGMICALWLAHYRIFRHRFIARTPDVVVNFIFLFGIAVLPYAVQTFLRFGTGHNSIILYFGDFALVLTALATLRWSALRQRRNDGDTDVRLREWRGTLRQYTLVVIIVIFLVAVNAGAVPVEKLFSLLSVAIVVVTLVVRFTARRLPRFLDSPARAPTSPP